ncbi:MAG: response regulator, partial [candidate division WOR-3 bacterium]|nr:response regulator [candidate division WOR-3 bacterium]
MRDAATGKEAILKVQEDIPNVVLLDLRLPDMDGREVLLKIKEINKDIPVIIITGYADLEIARNILKEGACDFVVKPFDLNYLETSVL